jgi:hypothetical protein
MHTTPLAHVLLLLLATPLQLGLAVLNGRRQWFTPGELRFWAVAVFIILEIAYLILL